MNTILKTSNLNKVYKLGGFINRVRINALDEVNLTIESDEPVIISIVGESGSGKTTLAKVILRLIKPTSGSALVYDQMIAGKGDQPSNREYFSTVQPIFQNPFEAFSAHRTVNSYLSNTAVRVAKLSKTEAVDAMTESLSLVGLEYRDVRGKYSNQFSGGELQRVSIARALIPDPKIIIADEPVSMIDASLRMNVINLFLSLKRSLSGVFCTLPMTWLPPITLVIILGLCIGAALLNSVMPGKFWLTLNTLTRSCCLTPFLTLAGSGRGRKWSYQTSRPKNFNLQAVDSPLAVRLPKISVLSKDRLP